MKMKKYIVTLVLALLCVVAVKPMEVQATTFEDLKVTVADDLRNYDQKVELSWKLDWNLSKEAGVTEQIRYGKFTLPEKCYVRIKASTDEGAYDANNYLNIYGNASMAVPIAQTDGWVDTYLLLDKGTYYLECKSELYMSSTSQHTTKVMIGAIPEDKAFNVTKTVSQDGKSVTITAEQKLGDELSSLKYIARKETSAFTIRVVGETIDPTTQSFTVTKNGEYTVLIQPKTTVAFDTEIEYLEYVTVNEIGANLKKGTTYKSGNMKYKLVTAGLNGTGTVMVTGVVKQKSSVTIPKTVTLKGHKYKIVKINKNAFKGKSKIKKITIKSTDITSIGKNAIKGIDKNATIKVPKSKLKDYKKLFKKSTGYKKTMKIKK